MISFFLNKIPRPWLIKISLWVRPILSFLLKGNSFEDPIDGNTFRKFLPYGYAKKRPNVLSPSSLSLERHRLLWLYLKNETDFFSKKQKVLHIAPEQAFYKKFKQLPDLEYVTADLNSPLADVKADLCQLPFENNSFDFILCNHVLEHIADDKKAMSELFRVMKHGGMGIFQVPLENNRAITFEDNSITDPKKRTEIFGQYDHLRIYGMDFFQKLESVGFQVEKVQYGKKFDEKTIERYRIVADEIIPVCRKK